MHYKNLTIIGTSHIAKQSIEEVKEAIEKFKPKIVAVELDPYRYEALKSRKKSKIRFKDIFKVGIAGFFFALLGSWAQKKLGKIVSIEPGTEMLTAVRLAKNRGIGVSFIDQEIFVTLKKISKTITLKEEIRFIFDIFKSLLFGKREMKKLGLNDINLTRVPEKKLIKKLMEDLKKRYPNIYGVLVEERNKIMASKLINLMKANTENIVAVVGAGHEEDILNLIKEEDKKENQEISYSFSINLK
ncbi:MAG: TraB/GumN family protein [Candidatus Woesearchaeota archaeon]|nr:TraB/GumN family protein [Candidatus Woesearchaeota archaeon]